MDSFGKLEDTSGEGKNISRQTKECPYCTGEIPHAAAKCRHCGEWLQDVNISRDASVLRGFPVWLVIIIVVVIAFFLASVVGGIFLLRDTKAQFRERPRAPIVACANNLKQIHVCCMLYEMEYEMYPFAGETAKAYEHLQLLVDTGFVEDPELFTCPSSLDKPASLDENGYFLLSPGTCSYAYSIKPLSTSSAGTLILAADEELGNLQHKKGVNVVYVGGNVEFIRVKDNSDKWKDLTKGQLKK